MYNQTTSDNRKRRNRKRDKIVKTGIAFPFSVLLELDKIAERLGIPNRSKAVVEATIKYIADNRWVYEDGTVAGALSIIYNNSNGYIQSRLLEIRNMFSYNINAVVNLTLDHDKSIDVWIVKGPVDVIRRIVEYIERLKGVYVLRAIVVSQTPSMRRSEKASVAS